MGDLPGGAFESIATDVTSDGSTIAGYSYSGNGFSEAFRWTAASGMVGLGDLPGGDFFSQANGVSADGSTVVGHSSSAADAGNYDEEAFRWTAAAGMVGLGDLPGGDFYSDALDVSADGSTVVGVSISTGDSFTGLQAFRWTSTAAWSRCGTCCSPTASTPPPMGGRSSTGPTASAPTATRSSATAFVTTTSKPSSPSSPSRPV